jgi:hypothetical protein
MTSEHRAAVVERRVVLHVLSRHGVLAGLSDVDGTVRWLSPAAEEHLRAAGEAETLARGLRSDERLAAMIDEVAGAPGLRATLAYPTPRGAWTLHVENCGDDPLLAGLVWWAEPPNAAATIARRLYVSPSTARNYLSSIYRKLGVSSHVGLVELLANFERRR